VVILDGAQSTAHNPEVLDGVDYDALCFAGHKMYGPSIGIIVAKKELVKELDLYLLGGGTVQDVQHDSYTLLPEDIGSHLELGLQDFAGIIGLDAGINGCKIQA
jgi:selenocysteine lyase/cysteine desulfurase